VRLAVCTIPDTPDSRVSVRTFFGGNEMSSAELRTLAASAGVADGETWQITTAEEVARGSQPVYVTDGIVAAPPVRLAESALGASAVAMMVVYCDPTQIIPEPGCVIEEETVPDTPPPPAPGPAVTIIPEPFPSAQILCEASTDYPHTSTTPGFIGRINVKAHNICPVPLSQTVSVTLQREHCTLWIFCGWATIAANTYTNPSARNATVAANTACSWQKGWYRGLGSHTTVFPQGTGTARTWTTAVRINCW